MENMSKAVIIAGAVLIAILLIGIGIALLNSSTPVVDQASENINSQAVHMFNSKFETYFGERVSGAKVKAFISKVIANNSKYSASADCILLNAYKIFDSKFTHKYKTSDLQTIYNAIDLSADYSILQTSGCRTYSGGYKNTGYIGCISITKL